MLKASQLKSKGFGADRLFEVSADGSPIATLNGTRLIFDLAGTHYAVQRQGALAPEYTLKNDEAAVATLTQVPMFNQYTLVCDGKEWILKALDMLANQFGLFAGDKQLGAISAGGWLSRLKDITVDLPDDLPRSVQLFLLLILVWHWTEN